MATVVCVAMLGKYVFSIAQNADTALRADAGQSGRGAPAAGQDYSVPLQPISALVRGQLQGLSGSAAQLPANARVRVQGIVLEQRLGEYIIVSDSTGTLVVETTQAIPLRVNELVELLGEPVFDGAQVYLKNAVFRQVTSNEVAFGERLGLCRPPELPLLTNAWQVRDLPPHRAAWKYPVRLRGVVTVCTPHRAGFVMQDEISGIYVGPARGRPNLKTGDLVEVEGVSDPGEFAPYVLATNITVLGAAPLPEPRQVSLFQLATGQEGSQWVEVRGVVRALTYTNGLAQLELGDLTGTLRVNVPTDTQPTNLLDAVVRIRGAAGSVFNEQRQLVGVRVWAPSLEFVHVEEPGTADPFSLPVQPIETLSHYRPRLSLQRRVVIAGTVTLDQPGKSFFVQDITGGVEVFTAHKEPLKPGDRVIVAGYPAFAEYGSVLRAAVYRVVGRGELFAPRKLSANQALEPELNARRVQADARVLDFARFGRDEVWTLQLGDRVFEARLPGRAGLTPHPPVGSMVQVTGVYKVLADEARVPVSFQILVPANQPVHVLSKPSWWTFPRLMIVLSAAAALGLVALCWVALLRRQVRKQTMLLRQQVERERALEEQYRTIFEGAKEIILTHDLDGRITSINPAGLELLGYSAEEVGELTIEKVVAPECRDDLKHMSEVALAQGEAIEHHIEFVTKTGQRRLAETYKRATFKNGQPVAVHCVARDVTERKRAEAALRESKAMYHSLVEQLPAGVFRKDAEGRYVFVNAQFCKLKGVKPELYLGKTPQEVAAIELAEGKTPSSQVTELAAQGTTHHLHIMRTGQTIEVEEHAVGADGKERYFHVVKSPILDSQGKVVGTQGVLLDITARKRAEAALAETSSLLEILLENIPDSIYFKDRQSRFVRFSKAFLELFKVSDPEVIKGKTDFDFFTEEHARPAFEDEQKIMRTGEPIIGKLEKETHTDGRITWCLTTKMPWRDNAGNIIGTFGISKDVTELKRIQDELARERELLQTLLDNIPDSIYFKDIESRFVRISRAKLMKALEHSPKLKARLMNTSGTAEGQALKADIVVGLSDFDILAEEDARVTYQDEQQIIRTGQPIIGKVEKQTRKDGTVYWSLTTKMPWRDNAGNIIGTFGISRDITALKEAQAEVERTHRRLVDMSRMAGMAAVASEVLHNVGNVLTSVNTSCSLAIEQLQQCDLSKLARVAELLKQNTGRLEEFLTTDPKGRFIPDYLGTLAQTFTETVASALAELTRLRSYVDHIKQIVAMQQSYAKVAGLEETIEVAQLVEDALRINEAALDRHTITVQRRLHPVPPILVDKHKVLQILVNLIRNAKYALSDSGRADKILTLYVDRNGDDKVSIRVIDNGIGIAPENLTRIFQHGFSTRGDGHGFGLHSSALLARELGGELTAHSNGPGKGATFTLVLPLKPPQRK